MKVWLEYYAYPHTDTICLVGLVYLSLKQNIRKNRDIYLLFPHIIAYIGLELRVSNEYKECINHKLLPFYVII